MARNWADCPDEVATAVTPPSSAAMRFSNTSYRLYVRSELGTPLSVTYNSRVADARVYMTKSPEIRSRNDRGKMGCRDAPQSKQICSMLQVDRESQANLRKKRKNNYSAIVEDKTRRGIDGHCPCVCSRIGCLTSMKLKSIEFWLSAHYISKNIKWTDKILFDLWNGLAMVVVPCGLLFPNWSFYRTSWWAWEFRYSRCVLENQEAAIDDAIFKEKYITYQANCVLLGKKLHEFKRSNFQIPCQRSRPVYHTIWNQAYVYHGGWNVD